MFCKNLLIFVNIVISMIGQETGWILQGVIIGWTSSLFWLGFIFKKPLRLHDKQFFNVFSTEMDENCVSLISMLFLMFRLQSLAIACSVQRDCMPIRLKLNTVHWHETGHLSTKFMTQPEWLHGFLVVYNEEPLQTPSLSAWIFSKTLIAQWTCKMPLTRYHGAKSRSTLSQRLWYRKIIGPKTNCG